MAPQLHPHDFTSEAKTLVAQLTVEEKAAFCSGKSFWKTEGCERLDLLPAAVSDGPVGLRKQAEGSDHLGLGGALPATCFPAGVNLGSTWDPSLVEEMAGALANECLAQDVSLILGPAINMKRSPLCGRNFEYFAEDPYLAGILTAAYVRGCQARGVGACVKHFAANNQEHGRMRVDTRVDERTLREIYLPAFERAVKEEQPWAIMSAYNQINGQFCSENSWLLDQVLRKKWGYKGFVVSDWGAVKDRVPGIVAGLDLEMPASGGINDRKVLAAVQNGELKEADLDKVVTRTVSFLLAADRARDAFGRFSDPTTPGGKSSAALLAANHKLAKKYAVESAVLLKNENNALPLTLERTKSRGRKSPPPGASYTIAVIGRMATMEALRIQGAGSSKINAVKIDVPLEAIREYADGKGAAVTYSAGSVWSSGEDVYAADQTPAVNEAVEAAEAVDAAVVFVGLPARYEVEGVDREHMNIPDEMNALVAAITNANSKTIVVLLGGASMALPTCGGAKAILWAGLGGQAVGGAIADLIFGVASPSGRLAETWPLNLSDCPSSANFADLGDANVRQVVYREAHNIGYRYFCTAGVPTQFPFGHGLTYSTFEYSKLQLSKSTITKGEKVTVKATIKNTGTVTASEVVQLYVRDEECCVMRPDRELKGFSKVRDLPPGKTVTVTMELDDRAFAFYDVNAQDWVSEAGAFELLVGASCEDIRLTSKLTLKAQGKEKSPRAICGTPRSENAVALLDDNALSSRGLIVPPATPLRPVARWSTFEEIRQTSWFGWCMVHILVMGARRTARSGGASGLGDVYTAEQVVVGGLLGSSLGSLQLMTGGVMPNHVLEALLHFVNGNFMSAILRLFGCKGPE